MTYIEFFDKIAIENICSSLARVPDRVILVGGARRTLERHAERYGRILAARGVSVEFITRVVNRNSVSSIVEALEEIVASYDDTAFDLTGGDELFFVAVGMMIERHPERRFRVHRFNVKMSSVSDVDVCSDDDPLEFDTPRLSVAENVSLYGGAVTSMYPPVGTEDTLSEEKKAEIDAAWRIARADPTKWNTQISAIALAESARAGADGKVTVERETRERMLRLTGGERVGGVHVMRSLIHAGLITDFAEDGGEVRFAFKSAFVKRLLTKSGEALEMKVYSTALACRDENGERLFCDVRQGVSIDWDGVDSVHDTENEIDVMLMRGVTPVFISCKNGSVGIDELYKLATVGERFGGGYARMVLIVSRLDERDSASAYLVARARDMGITLITNAAALSEAELERVLKRIR